MSCEDLTPVMDVKDGHERESSDEGDDLLASGGKDGIDADA